MPLNPAAVRLFYEPILELCHDRKGIQFYEFSSLCEACCSRATENRRQHELKMEQKKRSRHAKKEAMIENVRGIESTTWVPIDYALDKLLWDIRFVNRGNSRLWYWSNFKPTCPRT